MVIDQIQVLYALLLILIQGQYTVEGFCNGACIFLCSLKLVLVYVPDQLIYCIYWLFFFQYSDSMFSPTLVFSAANG